GWAGRMSACFFGSTPTRVCWGPLRSRHQRSNVAGLVRIAGTCVACGERKEALMSIRVSWAALACGALATLRPAPAHAQSTTVVPPPPIPVVAERSVVPNARRLGSGVGTLVLGYAPGVVVGIVSDHKGDNNLFIPVAGPWIDLGKRDCQGATVLTNDGPFELSSRSNCGTSDFERA